MNIKVLYLFLLVLAALPKAVVATGPATANDSNTKSLSSSSKQYKSSGSYCGVYCLYTLMKLHDIDVDPTELLKPEYIGSRKGSSLAELKKAAENHGLHAAPVGNLTSRELRQSPYPIILHVKSAADRKQYDHYELFWGAKEGQARLYDPPKLSHLVPFCELAPQWDGTGLIVSSEPIKLGVVFASTRRYFVMYVAIMVAIVLMVRWCRQRWMRLVNGMSRLGLFSLSIVQCTGLVFLALFGAMLYNFVNDEGFLACPNATASIRQAHMTSFIPKVNRRKVAKLLNTNTVFVDARFSDDFKANHLKGAINIPVDVNDLQRQYLMAAVAKDTRIVVYCYNSKYKFAETVATALVREGFSDVSIFTGGWQEWTVKVDK